jgi:hypothetical protein
MPLTFDELGSVALGSRGQSYDFTGPPLPASRNIAEFRVFFFSGRRGSDGLRLGSDAAPKIELRLTPGLESGQHLAAGMDPEE